MTFPVNLLVSKPNKILTEEFFIYYFKAYVSLHPRVLFELHKIPPYCTWACPRSLPRSTVILSKHTILRAHLSLRGCVDNPVLASWTIHIPPHSLHIDCLSWVFHQRCSTPELTKIFKWNLLYEGYCVSFILLRSSSSGNRKPSYCPKTTAEKLVSASSNLCYRPRNG